MRQNIALNLRRSAQVFFVVTIIMLPFRYRTLLVSRPFPPIYPDYTDVLLFTSDILLAGLLACWIASLVANPRPLRFGPFFLTIPILAFTMMGILSIPFSVDVSGSLHQSLRLITLTGLYLYIVNEIQSLDQIVLPVALQVILQATVGIAQVLSQHSLGLAQLGELILDPKVNGVSIVWAGGMRSLRAYGLTDHPNILGGCLAFALITLAGWYLSAYPRSNPIIPSVFALGSLGLLLTFSRSAWLALSIGLLLIALLVLRIKALEVLKNLIYLLLAAGVVLAPFLWQYAPYIGIRFNYQGSFTSVPSENQAVGERALLNQAANEIFVEHPLTGVGIGAFPVALQRKFPQFPVNYQPAHITLLEAAAETGIFGALFYMLALIAPWLALWVNRRHLIHPLPLIGVTGLLAAITVVSFFDYYTWLLAPGRLWQWLAWGLWAVLYHQSLEKTPHA